MVCAPSCHAPARTIGGFAGTRPRLGGRTLLSITGNNEREAASEHRPVVGGGRGESRGGVRSPSSCAGELPHGENQHPLSDYSGRDVRHGVLPADAHADVAGAAEDASGVHGPFSRTRRAGTAV